MTERIEPTHLLQCPNCGRIWLGYSAGDYCPTCGHGWYREDHCRVLAGDGLWFHPGKDPREIGEEEL